LSTPELQFASTQLVDNNTPEEINRALQEMLTKVNQVSKNATDMAKVLNVQDNLGHTIHQLPDANLRNNSYPMGHLYLHQRNIPEYRLYDASITTDVWTTITPVLGDNTNINGVRIKVFIDHAHAATYSWAMFCGRPTGSAWTSGFMDIAPSLGVYINGINTTEEYIIGVIDVPLGLNRQIDILAQSPPGVIDLVVVHQLGVWI
jgi:hypothetical protein